MVEVKGSAVVALPEFVEKNIRIYMKVGLILFRQILKKY